MHMCRRMCLHVARVSGMIVKEIAVCKLPILRTLFLYDLAIFNFASFANSVNLCFVAYEQYFFSRKVVCGTLSLRHCRAVAGF